MELCYGCEGKGLVYDMECEVCFGDGYIESESPITFVRGKQNRRKLKDEEDLPIDIDKKRVPK